jgi:hypothetical protein
LGDIVDAIGEVIMFFVCVTRREVSKGGELMDDVIGRLMEQILHAALGIVFLAKIIRI